MWNGRRCGAAGLAGPGGHRRPIARRGHRRGDPPQYRAIVVLCAHGPIAMRELADELTCSASTATRLCDRLVSKGLVDRGPREANRREVEVRATARGIELVRAVTARRRAEIRRIVDTMPAEQRPALVDALQAFAAAAGEAPDQAWAIGWDL
ncbi:MAG: MarR family transcriptional regulator [Acidimicrobiales bacterium]